MDFEKEFEESWKEFCITYQTTFREYAIAKRFYLAGFYKGFEMQEKILKSSLNTLDAIESDFQEHLDL